MTASTAPSASILSTELLARVHARAADYDRDNAFFADDFDELRATGYLRALVPTKWGGLGRGLREVVAEQQRLAAAAPATALAINMHLVWTGAAKLLHDRGDDTLDFVLREAAGGEIFGFGISEGGNDLMLFGSRSVAAPQPNGGYRFTGTKVFTSLSPAWTRLGTMGLDTESADAPKIVYGFVDRSEGKVTNKDDWYTLGMRASQSQSTVLEGAYASPDRVVRRLDPGPNADPLIFAISANFQILLAAVYTGIGARALELAVEAVKRRTSMKYDGRVLAQDPDIRWRIADAAMAMDAIGPQLDGLAREIDEQFDHGARWFALISGLKHRAVENARHVVDQALRVSGGGAYFEGSELGRLYRDVLAGIFHPSDAESAHNTVATSLLGPLE